MTYAASARTAFADMLGTLDHLVAKAINAGMSDDMLAARLADDMFPLELQLRIALNQVLLALNQVGGQSLPLHEDSYGSLTEARERIADVRAALDRVDPSGWARPDAVVDLTLPNGIRLVMSAEDDIRDWLLPNFYFHVTMAYAVLRHAGLAIGKMDFLPHMHRHIVTDASG